MAWLPSERTVSWLPWQFVAATNQIRRGLTTPTTTVESHGEEYQVGYYFTQSEGDSASRYVAYAKGVEGGERWQINSDVHSEALEVVAGEGESMREAFDAMSSKLHEHLGK